MGAVLDLSLGLHGSGSVSSILVGRCWDETWVYTPYHGTICRSNVFRLSMHIRLDSLGILGKNIASFTNSASSLPVVQLLAISAPAGFDIVEHIVGNEVGDMIHRR